MGDHTVFRLKKHKMSLMGTGRRGENTNIIKAHKLQSRWLKKYLSGNNQKRHSVMHTNFHVIQHILVVTP
jgi:hypothetical protein